MDPRYYLGCLKITMKPMKNSTSLRWCMRWSQARSGLEKPLFSKCEAGLDQSSWMCAGGLLVSDSTEMLA